MKSKIRRRKYNSKVDCPLILLLLVIFSVLIIITSVVASINFSFMSLQLLHCFHVYFYCAFIWAKHLYGLWIHHPPRLSFKNHIKYYYYYEFNLHEFGFKCIPLTGTLRVSFYMTSSFFNFFKKNFILF